MLEIGLLDAEKNLLEIAERVSTSGEPVALTKQGRPFVDLVPHNASSESRRIKAEVIADLESLRATLPKFSMTEIRQAIEEGRE